MVSITVTEPERPAGGGGGDSPSARPRAFASPDLGIERARANELRLRGMFDAELDFVWRAVRRLGLDEGAADDAAQETFVIAARKIDTIEVGRERSFLLGTAIRIAANVRRTRAYRDRREAALRERDRERHELGHPEDRQASELPLPDEQVEARRALVRLDQALDMLPDELREVIVLTELEALPQIEIASLLGLPVGTVASRLRRARRELATTMSSYEADPKAANPASKEMPS